MYKKTYEGINKENREYFKQRILDISQSFKISFVKDKATITYSEPYIMDECDIENKSIALGLLRNFFNDFRHYQFNNNK